MKFILKKNSCENVLSSPNNVFKNVFRITPAWKYNIECFVFGKRHLYQASDSELFEGYQNSLFKKHFYTDNVGITAKTARFRSLSEER